MQSAEERRRLLERYGAKQPSPLGAVLKCAAGLLALVAITGGPWPLRGAERQGAPDRGTSFKAARAMPRSLAESRRLYEERRRRGERDTTGSRSAGTWPQLTPRLPAEAGRYSVSR